MTRIAFTMIGGKLWTGGYNYLLNLVGLTARYGNGRIVPVLFFGTDVPDSDVSPFLAIMGATVVRSPLMNQSRKRASLFHSVVSGADAQIRDLFQKQRIDAIFENAQFFGRCIGIPAIAWIPDFQHRHLRQLFGFGGYWKRELGFRAQIAGGRFVMLSSEDARSDCLRFHPSAKGRTQVVYFAIPARETMSAAQARTLADGYSLPEHYFFMPNQFWRHKNHALVVEALALVRKRGGKVVVVASGQQNDPRDRHYVPRLLARVEQLAIGEFFRPLGMIPYDHLLGLMRASQALLNPSCFEGWSTTVEEARALGVPLLLSDINVHREQADGQAQFFAVNSSHALADALSSHQPLHQELRESMAVQASTDSDVRVRRFVTDFIQVVEHACASHSHTFQGLAP